MNVLGRLVGMEAPRGWVLKWKGKGRSAQTGKFMNMVLNAVGNSSWNCKEALGELEDRFSGFARLVVEGVGDEVCGAIWDAIVEATQEVRDEMQERLTDGSIIP